MVKIAVGQTARLTLDALPGKTLTGKVGKIDSRYIEKRGDTTYTVTLILDPPPAEARWGMNGQVQFSEDK